MDNLTRGQFVARSVGGVFALGVGMTACRSTSQSITEGALEAAMDRLEEEGVLEPLKQIVDGTAGSVENVEAISGVVREFLEDPNNQANAAETLENVRRVSGDLAYFTGWARRWLELLESLASPELLLAAVTYSVHRLVAEVGRIAAEVIITLVYLIFLARVRALIDRLRREYWWIRWVLAVY